MRLPALRRILPLLGLVLLTLPTTGCLAFLEGTNAVMEQANGVHYRDASYAKDVRLTCSTGTTVPGYVRIYEGVQNNYGYVYAYNATRFPIEFEVIWNTGSDGTQIVQPGTYSRRSDRWASVGGQMRYRGIGAC